MAHERAALTLNFIRALIDGGFADLHHPEYWDLDFVQPLAARGRVPTASSTAIRDRVRFVETLTGVADRQPPAASISTPGTRRLRCPTSRRRPARSRAAGLVQPVDALPVDRHAHRALDGAHVEFFRGIRNPLGIKVGPAMTPE